MDEKKRRKPIDADTLDFARDHVLNITDITRKNKLSEIMERFSAQDENDDVYVIQNSKKKGTAVVLADVEHYKELLNYKEELDKLQDKLVEMEAIARLNSDPNGSVSLEDLAESLSDDGIKIDFDSLNAKVMAGELTEEDE
ncbi:hypothetical protein HUG15_20310 [Salicibibacter cibarius]|uniref:Uncharacterized protein n=1 Tax=Salicibibacter cibarius TaxID=2743000 RepID=A0A7T6Z6B8_9BACI|nr:hypothetical protein [Salicibibacter cibarius]QQK77694.1 hypothetical protein HUG15_20310 [Salicibibacter cibarius]